MGDWPIEGEREGGKETSPSEMVLSLLLLRGVSRAKVSTAENVREYLCF